MEIVPNGVAQEHLLQKALAHAQLQANEIGYIEMHGTGTIIGDPMEMHALSNVYQNSHYESVPLYVGSVKANIGHLEAAAGLAGLIKVILSLHHEKIPPQIHVNTLNPKLNLTTIPAQIPFQAMEWKRLENKKRYAGISSFGFSGTNTHVIVEEGYIPNRIPARITQDRHLLIISAKTETALQALINNYIIYLEKTTDNIENICYTSQVGRYHFENTIAVLGDSIETLIAQLKEKKFINADFRR